MAIDEPIDSNSAPVQISVENEVSSHSVSETLNKIQVEDVKDDPIQAVDEPAGEESKLVSTQTPLLPSNTAADLVGSGSNQVTQTSQNSPWTNNNNTNAKRDIMCRICHSEETSEEYLISPCYCNGTLRFVHQSCLQQWLRTHGIKSCELCKFDFIMQTKVQPFKNWKKLHINSIERRKIFCSVLVNFIVVVAFLWSLFVLINNTAKEYALRPNDWDFWAKLVLAAIGCTGGAIFMYIQCKTYYHLCLRWRQHNRIIVIQPITEEMLKTKSNKPKPPVSSKKSQESSSDINLTASPTAAPVTAAAASANTSTNANSSLLTSNFIYPISSSSGTFNVSTINEEAPADSSQIASPASRNPTANS